MFIYSRDEYESILQSKDDIAPVGYLNLMKMRLIDKNVS